MSFSRNTLQDNLNNVMMALGAIQSQVGMMDDRKLVLMHHKGKISLQGDGYYRTWVKDEKGGRKLLSSRSEENLEDKIYQYYKNKEQAYYFREVYKEWIREKEELDAVKKSSLTRYDIDFRRFFPEEEEFCQIKLRDMNEDILQRFLRKSVKQHGLSKKAYAGLRLLVREVLGYAYRKKYTGFDVHRFDFSFIPGSYFTEKGAKKREEEVFTNAELKKLVSYIEKHPDTRNLAIYVQLYTGMRVGELVALKPSDNIGECILHVCRTEFDYKDEKTGKRTKIISDHTKSGSGNRNICVPQCVQEVLDQLKEKCGNAEYLFSENGKRLTSKQINYRLRKVCKEIGIVPKSTHKLRRSYISKLLSESVDAVTVQAQAGHKDITTTYKYYTFDISDTEQKQLAVENALKF